jgi:hypothetical protein
MATRHTAAPAPTVGSGSDQLQADIAAALSSQTTLPPYDEVLRLIDTLKGHLSPLVGQAKEHVNKHLQDATWQQAITEAEFRLQAGPGSGLVSATHRLQGLARCVLHLQRHLHYDVAGGDQ